VAATMATSGAGSLPIRPGTHRHPTRTGDDEGTEDHAGPMSAEDLLWQLRHVAQRRTLRLTSQQHVDLLQRDRQSDAREHRVNDHR